MIVMTQTQIEPHEIARRIVDVLADHQAEDVVQLEISAIASFADYFVIATGLNPRHMTALLNALDKDLPNEGIQPLRREGEASSGWVLVDFGAVIVHVFTPEDRVFYDLEGLWSRAGVPAVRFQ
jgi:ribosome-associated protein